METKAATENGLSGVPLRALLEEARALMTRRHGVDYRLLVVLRELDQRERASGQPIHLARWLHETFGIGYGAARDKVRTARALGSLPEIDHAFRMGILSYAKVRALTRVATADNEAQLLAAAEHASAERVELMVKRHQQRERLHDVRAMLAQRYLKCYWDDDGMLVVHGRLTPDQGALWVKAVDRHREPTDSDDGYAARQADAATQAMEASLSGAGGATGDRYQVVVHVAAETLSAGSGAQPGKAPAYIESGPHLHPEMVKRLTCDGALVTFIEGDGGEPLNVGRKTRVIHPSIRRALRARDRHCQYPGCAHDKYVDGHHIVHWSRGGETRLDNLVLLCRRHHRMVHELGYSVRKTARGYRFTPP